MFRSVPTGVWSLGVSTWKSTMTDSLTIKASCGDELRRFALPEKSVKNLNTQAAARFGLDAQDVRIQYKDDEGDLVDVSSDEELHAALEVLPAGSVLRIVVSARAAPGVQNAKPKCNDKDKDKAELKLLRALEKDAQKKEKEAKKEARQARKAAKESGINLQENICQLYEIAGFPSIAAGTEPLATTPTMTQTTAPIQTQTETLTPVSTHTHVQTHNPVLSQTHTQTNATQQTQNHTQTAPLPTTQTGTTQASAAPTEEHLQSLLRAAVETLELPADAIYDQIKALTPEKIRQTFGGQYGPAPLIHMIHTMIVTATSMGAAASAPGLTNFPPSSPPPRDAPSPTPPFPGHNFGSRGMPRPPVNHMPFVQGGYPLANMISSFWQGQNQGHNQAQGQQAHQGQGQGPRMGGRHAWSGRGCPLGGNQNVIIPTIDTAPPLPEGVLFLGSTGDAVTALQKNLYVLKFLYTGPRFFLRWAGSFDHKTQKAVANYQDAHGVEGVERGVFCEETRASMASKIESLREQALRENLEQERKAAAPQYAHEVDRVEITDTQGDVMVFTYVDGRVQETVNGKPEIDDVQHLSIDAAKGRCSDAKGTFVIPEEDRAEKIELLRALLKRVEVQVQEVSQQEQTIELDIDMNVSPDEREAQRIRAQEAVRKACEAMGMRPDAAINQLQQVFSMANSAAGAEGNSRMANAASASIFHAAECLAAAATRFTSAAHEEVASQNSQAQETEASDDSDGDYVDVHEPAMEEPTKEDTAETVTTGTPIPEDASIDEFANEIAMLRGMGFDGAEEGLIDMLRKKQGDVNAVVNELLMV